MRIRYETVEEKEHLLNTAEASKIIGIAESTLRQFVSERRISHIKIGASVRFSKELLNEFIKESTVKRDVIYNLRNTRQKKWLLET